MWQYITLTKRIYLIDCPGIVPTSAKDSITSTVLKGVVRVEALATPSEHIPTLMERVKPVYLSRTYGVPLPDPNDSAKGWEPETFLDKLARMKGRLLKGGEPDLESVSKIVLSDWVRGRIPFFVPPPERTEELNHSEAKKAKIEAVKAKGKGKAKATEEEPRKLSVHQNIGSIMQKNTFVAEDIQPIDVEVQDEEESVDGGEKREAAEESEAEEKEEELAWGDVFPEDTEAPPFSELGEELDQGSCLYFCPESSGDLSDFFIDDAVSVVDSETETAVQKDARMKTNKVYSNFFRKSLMADYTFTPQRKATNFYTNTNVKNKNRSKSALMKALKKGKGGGGEGKKR